MRRAVYFHAPPSIFNAPSHAHANAAGRVFQATHRQAHCWLVAGKGERNELFDVPSRVAAERLHMLKQCANSLVAYWMRRAAIKQLRLLDNCELREIGSSRCRIEVAAHGLQRPHAKRVAAKLAPVGIKKELTEANLFSAHQAPRCDRRFQNN
jgi:hypothetical protein